VGAIVEEFDVGRPHDPGRLPGRGLMGHDHAAHPYLLLGAA
jgi:hypothetical protein